MSSSFRWIKLNSSLNNSRTFSAQLRVTLSVDYLDVAKVRCGEIQAECGAAAYDYIQRAISAAMTGKTQAIVTAPIHKAALQLAGVPFHGHTEMLAAQTNTEDYCMMLTSPEISVCLVTTHLAISKVPASISEERIFKVIELAAEAMERMSEARGRRSEIRGQGSGRMNFNSCFESALAYGQGKKA